MPTNKTTVQNILVSVILPTEARLKPHKITISPAARAMLLAIGLQESALTHRYQVISGGGKGPARGLWQFERGGGVKGVLTHPSSSKVAGIFASYHVATTELVAVHAALEHDDILACAFARLLLFTDPRALPQAMPENEQAAWEYYLRNWRPGKPHPDAWPSNWRAALETLKNFK